MNDKSHQSEESPLEVIALKPENLNACIKLDQLVLEGLWSKQQWKKELSDSKRLCLGIFDRSNLIAFVCGWLIVDELHLTAIAVHPLHRRLGLAKVVLTNLLLIATKKGCRRATLEVNSSNSAALALYKSSGFETAGSRRNYYKNGSDALIQWKSLKP